MTHDVHDLFEDTAFMNMGQNGSAVKTFTINGLPDQAVIVMHLHEIHADHLGGQAPGSYEIQIWNKADADHFANLDNDMQATIYKKTGINPASKFKETEADFGDTHYINRDTSGARNRIYVGINITGGDATTDMEIRIVLGTRE